MGHPLLRRAAGLVLAFAALHAVAAPGTVRVGFIAPLTGPASDFGTSALVGAQLAVAEINEVGGYLGRRLELVVKDDTGVPATAKKHAEAVLGPEKVDFTIAAGSSGSTMAMMELFQSQKHLLMIGMATASSLTTKFPPSSSYVFRLAASDSVQAAFLVNEVAARGYKRVSIFADRTGYGEGGLKDVLQFLEKKGLQPVHVARFDVGVPSLKEELLKAKAAQADVIISYSVGPEHALIARERVALKMATKQFAPWTGSSRVVWDKGGEAVNGLISVQTFIADTSNERRTSFVSRLKTVAAGKPVHSFMAAAQHYDAVHLLLRAMFQTKGDTSGTALKAALEDLKQPYAGVVTTHEKPYTSQDHDAFTSSMAWLAEWHNGELRFHNAEDARRVSFIRRKRDTPQLPAAVMGAPAK